MAVTIRANGLEILIDSEADVPLVAMLLSHLPLSLKALAEQCQDLRRFATFGKIVNAPPVAGDPVERTGGMPRRKAKVRNAIRELLSDGQRRTVNQIREATGLPHGSVEHCLGRDYLFETDRSVRPALWFLRGKPSGAVEAPEGTNGHSLERSA